MHHIYLLLSIFSTVSAFTIQSTPSRNILQNTNILQSSYSTATSTATATRERRTSIILSDAKDNTSEIKVKTDDEDDDDEWEYEEYESLTERDFYDSEWKVGTLMENSNKIEETWTRLVVKDGEFICVWGDGASGKWNFDAASQFLSMSKDTIGGWLGKKIWAGTLDDYYFVEGTIRGWSPISPASVVGQWQAKRLGVDKDEAGIAPWFQEDEEEEEAPVPEIAAEEPKALEETPVEKKEEPKALKETSAEKK